MEENIITLEHINKVYGKMTALSDVNLSLKRGRIYGLIGKNGAGKTTMMRILAGLSFPTKGDVTVNTGRIGMLIEQPTLNGDMTAEENLRFYRMLAGAEKKGLTDGELLKLVGLSEGLRRKVKDFSLGMRGRLGIAIALLGNPEFIMLDEPLNGLDPIGVVEIRELFKKINSEFGVTLLISSHNLPELYQTATDHIILDQGVIKKEISQKELEREGQDNLETYFLSVIRGGENK